MPHAHPGIWRDSKTALLWRPRSHHVLKIWETSRLERVKKCKFAISEELTFKNLSFRTPVSDDRDGRIDFGSSEKSAGSISSHVPVPFAPFAMEIALTVSWGAPKLTPMVVHLKPETESRLQELAATTGRALDELVEDAMTGYLAELAQVRDMLDGRYDDMKSGRVQPVDGEEAIRRLRQKSQDRRRS
jgi:predicted transcriptional regulator